MASCRASFLATVRVTEYEGVLAPSLANYYEKLTRIFLTAGNALFHAAAWARYWTVVRTTGSKSEEELARIAGQVLVSALAVPVGQASEDDEVKGRTSRLTALLGLTKTPTRTGLLQEAVSHI